MAERKSGGIEGDMMQTEVLIALIGLTGSAVGTFAGILTAAKLTNYRIGQLITIRIPETILRFTWPGLSLDNIRVCCDYFNNRCTSESRIGDTIGGR